MTTSSPDADVSRAPIVFDGHVDLIYTLQKATPVRTFADTEQGPLTPRTLRNGHVRMLNSALYCFDHFNGPSAAQHLKQLLFLSASLSAELPLISSREALDAAWSKAGRVGKLLLLENADALVDLGSGPLAAWGIRTIGLTHAGANRLADGNAVAHPQGLKPAARPLLGEFAQAGLVIDLAHLAEPGFWQIIDGFAGRICCSHTGLRRFCDTPRNLSEDQVRAILVRDGVVGLAFAPELLRTDGQAGLETVFRQLDHLVQRFGCQGIGLGTDLGGYPGKCRGLESHGRIESLLEKMVLAGYPAAAIDALLGGNWYRFYRGILPEDARY